jgi:hypothetical protein
VRDLPLEDLALANEDVRVTRFHELERGDRRRQGITEFVTEHREELILGAIGVLGLGPRGVRPAYLVVALTGAIGKQRRCGGKRSLQPRRLGDVSLRVAHRPPFGDGGCGIGRSGEIVCKTPRHHEHRAKAAEHEQEAAEQ